MTPKENENNFEIDWEPIHKSLDNLHKAMMAALKYIEDNTKIDAKGMPYFVDPNPNEKSPIIHALENHQDEPHLIAETSEEADELIDMWLKGRD